MERPLPRPTDCPKGGSSRTLGTRRAPIRRSSPAGRWKLRLAGHGRRRRGGSGRNALHAESWEEARGAFDEALLEEDSPEALEGTVPRLWRVWVPRPCWLDDAQVAIDAREGAYRLFRERADAEGAARTAAGVANDLLTFRGDPAVAADGYKGLAAGSKTGPTRRNSLARRTRGGSPATERVKATDVMIGS
jgi:hypothetical protein